MEEDGENQIQGEMPQSCGAPREATAPPASACLDPAPREVREASTTSTATPPCSLGGSGLAGRRQTKPTQLSSQPGILEDPAVPGITQGLIITGHQLLSACTPLSAVILEKFGFSISRSTSPQIPQWSLTSQAEPRGKVWFAAILTGTLLGALRILPAGTQMLSQMNAEATPHLSPQQPAEGRN